MTSGEREVQAANPPADAEPDAAAIAEPPEADEEAENQPGKEHEEGGLEEDGLRLRELPDGVEGEYALGDDRDGVVNPGTHHPLGGGNAEELAGFGGGVVEVSGIAGAQRSVVAEGIEWTA